MGRRIGQQDLGLRQAIRCDPTARDVEHGVRDVDAEDAAVCPDPFGQRQHCGAAAAADIQNPLARNWSSRGDCLLGDAGEEPVETLLQCRPFGARIAVPIGNLVGVRRSDNFADVHRYGSGLGGSTENVGFIGPPSR